MTGPRRAFDRDALAGEVLAGKGTIRLEFLLERLVPARALREFARKHDVKVKGFRIERAPIAKLAPVLVKAPKPVVDGLCELVLHAVSAAVAEDAPPPVPTDPATPELDRLRGELGRARRERDRAREQAERARAGMEDMRAALDREQVAAASTRSRIRHLERELEAARSGSDRPRGDGGRVRQLERELDALGESEERLRRQIALELTARRDAEERADELEAELDEVAPKRRGRRRPRAAPTEHGPRLRIPHFGEAFVKSVETMDRRTVEAAYRAVFVLCTEGPSYPSLEHKKLEGQQELHSVRAGIKVRVYFRYLPKGDIDLVEVSDREDQDTLLRRLKER